jgi:hypothetical protein
MHLLKKGGGTLQLRLLSNGSVNSKKNNFPSLNLFCGGSYLGLAIHKKKIQL